MKEPHNKLFEQGILHPEQFEYLEKINSKQLFSVYFELRSLLYIGVLLLTTGIGFIIYLNMGQLAHLALLTVMLTFETAVFWYIQKYAKPYSNTQQKPSTPYFDYVLLFGALLVISIFTYVMLQYDLLETLLEWSSLLSAALFFYLAFRYDHRGVLALAITAFAAFWGLSVSPIDWASNQFMDVWKLYNTGIVVGLAFVGTSEIIDRKNIKKHFAFTFKNFGLILFYLSALSTLFESNNWGFYAWGIMILSLWVSISSWKKQEYLFFVYGAIAGYYAFTRLLIEVISDSAPFELWMIYVMASMGALIWMITSIISNKRKNHQL